MHMIRFLGDEKKYILTVLLSEMLLSIIWIYPYSLPAKLFLLGWGIILFTKRMVKKEVFKKDCISWLLLVSCLFSFISCLYNRSTEGLSCFKYFLSNIVLFGVIFSYVRSQPKAEQSKAIKKYAKYYIFISLLISLISLWMLVNKIGYTYYPSDNIMSNFLEKLNLMRVSKYGYMVGITTAYLDGCVYHCSVLASWAFLSIILSVFLFSTESVLKKIFLAGNIIIQIITIIAAGMRREKLAFLIFICLFIWFEGGRYGKKVCRKVNYLFRVGLIFIMCFLWQATDNVVSNIIEQTFLDRTRDYSQMVAEILTNENNNHENNNILEDADKSNEISEDISATIKKTYYELADELVQNNRRLYLLNEVSNFRIKLWITGVIKLKNQPLLGFASNNIEVLKDGELQSMGLHSEFFTELNMHGIIGTLCIMIVWCVAMKNALICFYKDKNRKWVIVSSYAVALMAASFFGTLLTFSISFMPVLFWILMGIIIPNNKNEWIQSVCEV